MNQFLAHDDGREGSDGSGDSDVGAAAESAKNKAMAKNDHFDSKATPDKDSFIQEGSVSRKAKQPMDDDDGEEYGHETWSPTPARRSFRLLSASAFNAR